MVAGTVGDLGGLDAYSVGLNSSQYRNLLEAEAKEDNGVEAPRAGVQATAAGPKTLMTGPNTVDLQALVRPAIMGKYSSCIPVDYQLQTQLQTQLKTQF